MEIFNRFRCRRLSEAHLLLLSKFRWGDLPSHYNDDENWESVLKETARKAIKKLIKQGLLEPAGLLELLNFKFKVTDLKIMLKERGLKASGHKQDLIERLVQHEPEKMKNATKGIELYFCTPKGKDVAERYLTGAKDKKSVAEQEVLASLKKRALQKAARIVAAYEMTQVFSRGLGIDFSEYDPGSDVRTLKLIFDETPGILKGIEESRLEKLRLAAAMMHLWGTNRAQAWLPEGFETGTHLWGDAAARMFIFYAIHKGNMEQYREHGVKTVENLGVKDNWQCSPCRKISGKKYSLGKVPELPYPKCTSPLGCRCTMVVEDFR